MIKSLLQAQKSLNKSRMTKISIKYVMKKITIDKSNISKFQIDAVNRRKLREGKVKELVQLLKNGEHFSSPFVINELTQTEKWKLIDANHREEACERMIKEDNSFKIDVWMAVYRDLTPDEEREVFKMWNSGTIQSATDFLKMHFPTIPLGRELLRRLPIATIYGDKNHMSLKNVVGNQICAKEHKKFNGGYSGGFNVILDDFRNLTLDDISKLEDFIEFMRKCFGPYTVDNQYYKTTPFAVFYRVWFDNQHISEDQMVKIFRKIFIMTPGNRWLPFTKSGGKGAALQFYGVVMSVLNSVSPRIHFKNDEEAIEEFNKIDKILVEVKALNKTKTK